MTDYLRLYSWYPSRYFRLVVFGWKASKALDTWKELLFGKWNGAFVMRFGFFHFETRKIESKEEFEEIKLELVKRHLEIGRIIEKAEARQGRRQQP